MLTTTTGSLKAVSRLNKVISVDTDTPTTAYIKAYTEHMLPVLHPTEKEWCLILPIKEHGFVHIKWLPTPTECFCITCEHGAVGALLSITDNKGNQQSSEVVHLPNDAELTEWVEAWWTTTPEALVA